MAPELLAAALELANNIAKIIVMETEAQPVEIRRAQAIVAWQVYWSIFGPLFPESTRQQVESIVKGVSK